MRGRVSLVVSWIGTDLRRATVRSKPGVELTTKTTTPMVWRVNGVTRTGAHVVSTVDVRPGLCGTPTDAAVVQAIQELKPGQARHLLNPFILMDIPAANTLPNPIRRTAARPVSRSIPGAEGSPVPRRRLRGHGGQDGCSRQSQVTSFFRVSGAGQFEVSVARPA